ncbi:MAG: YeeE/YedE family protein [Desulfovibrionales bacterium]|nr:YeeE/YedE family protein [Desulfovibrionales bacterium]
MNYIESVFASERVAQLDYFVRVTPKIEWQWMFVVGILIGSFIAAKTSGTFKKQWVPDMWQKKFGLSPVKRGIMAFCGGTIAMFGARMAGG